VEERIELLDTPALLARARQGDAPAFCVLVQPLETRLLQQAIALCRDASAAEDLVSETLVQAWKSLANYNETCRLSTWLYAILLHRHQSSCRAARSRPRFARVAALRPMPKNIEKPNISCPRRTFARERSRGAGTG
jgi:DNA-directed RNA polymerase specialized sigma24 family protein